MNADIYCEKIITKQLPVKVLMDTDQVLAFEHSQPYWPVHIVVIPKRHIGSLTTLSAEEEPILIELMKVAQNICSQVEKLMGAVAFLATSALINRPNTSLLRACWRATSP